MKMLFTGYIMQRKNVISRSVMLRVFTCWMLLALSFAGVRGQDIRLHASFSRDTILIGDQLDFSFTLEQPVGLHVDIPEFSDTLPGGLEILRTLENDTVNIRNAKLKIIRKYRVTSFDTSVVTVPPIEVSYERDSLKVKLATPPLFLYVKTMPVDTAKTIADIKAPYKAPLTIAEVLPYIAGLLILLIAGYVLYRYLENRKKTVQETPAKQKPTEPAHVIALRDLNKLREDKLWQKGEVKHYYTRLSDILRVYLKHRYDINAPEMTTGESLSALKRSGFNDKKLIQLLRDILETADLVKFAKYNPLPEKNESVLLDAVVFVNGTKPAWNKEMTGKAGSEEHNGKQPSGVVAAETITGEEVQAHE